MVRPRHRDHVGDGEQQARGRRRHSREHLDICHCRSVGGAERNESGQIRQALPPEQEGADAEHDERVTRPIVERLTEVGDRPYRDAGGSDRRRDGEHASMTGSRGDEERRESAVHGQLEAPPRVGEAQPLQERGRHRVVAVPVARVAMGRVARPRVAIFDKPVQRGALVLPRLHVLDVDQGSDGVRPDVAVTVRDHLQDDAVVVLVEPAPTVERQIVRVDELSRGECLLHPRDQRIAVQRCRPQGKSQEAGIQCRDERDGPMNAGGADAPAAGAFV